MWALVRPLRACNLLCERSSGMSFICAVKRAGCIVWIRWVKAGLIGQPCCGEGRGGEGLRGFATGGRAEMARLACGPRLLRKKKN